MKGICWSDGDYIFKFYDISGVQLPELRFQLFCESIASELQSVNNLIAFINNDGV